MGREGSLGDLGTRFRLARENKNISLQQAERDTRIRRKYLQALEDMDLARLPPAVYVKGFVRNYASYLGLNPNEMLDLYHRAAGQETAPETSGAAAQPTTVPESPPPAPTRSAVPSVRPPTRPMESRFWFSPNLLIGLAVIVAVVLAAWFLLTSSVYQDLVRPTTPSASVVFPTRTSTTTIAIDETPTAFTGQTPVPTVKTFVKVQVRALPDSYGCWLEVYVDGREDFRGLLQPGASQTWVGEERITMHVGNAGGVEVFVNDLPQGPLGAPGQVVDVEWTRPGAGTPPSATPPLTPSATSGSAPAGTPTITHTPTVPVVTSTSTSVPSPTPTGTPFPTVP